MRTVSMALLLSLSLTTACAAETEDGPEPGQANAASSPATSERSPAAPALETPPDASAPGTDTAEPAAADPEPAPDDAGPPPPAVEDAGVIIAVPLLLGRIIATTPSGWCNFTLDGVYKGGMATLDVMVPIGDHEVRCQATDGRTSTVSVNVGAFETETLSMVLPPPPPPAGPGTLVAVAVGGSCSFSVNGAAKGTSSQLKLTVAPGTYSVSCKPAEGAQKTRSVVIKSGETAMAMFKLQ